MEQCGECHSLAFRHGRAAVHTELEVQGDTNRAGRRRVSSRQAGFEVLGRNNGGAEVVVGKLEDSLTCMNKGIEGALGCDLTIVSGPILSVSQADDGAGKRGCGKDLLT